LISDNLDFSMDATKAEIFFLGSIDAGKIPFAVLE
jgi:hypothetical protein